jgi:hypothetical protein
VIDIAIAIGSLVLGGAALVGHMFAAVSTVEDL